MQDAGCKDTRFRMGKTGLPRHRETTVKQGYTLIELVIVMLVLAILAAVGGPRFYESLAFHQVESAASRAKLGSTPSSMNWVKRR